MRFRSSLIVAALFWQLCSISESKAEKMATNKPPASSTGSSSNSHNRAQSNQAQQNQTRPMPVFVPQPQTPAPIPRPPQVIIPPPIVQAPRQPIPPAPMPIIIPPAPQFTTTVRAPINPRMFKTKSGNPAQTYLGNIADIRDLEAIIDNTRAQYRSSLTSLESFELIFEKQQRLLELRAISPNEFSQALFDVEYSRANSKVYKAMANSYVARKEQRIYQAKVAARKEKFEVETLYSFYVQEWDAQCEASAAFLEASEAQLKFNKALYDTVYSAHQSNAASTFEVEVRKRDYAAALSDVQAKKETLTKCREGLPTLSELKEM